MGVVIIMNKKKDRKGIIKECGMGIIVKLGKFIKQRKHREGIR